MPSRSQCSRVLIALAIAVVPVFSNRVWADDLERIRPESPVLKAVMATALERSATFRSLVERIERSDLIVYVTCSQFESVTLAGRTLLASARPGVRYVRVQILCQQSQPALVSIVAHELQHVVEIGRRQRPSTTDHFVGCSRRSASLRVGRPGRSSSKPEPHWRPANAYAGRLFTTRKRACG
jgi:hypothetical protein